MKPELSIIIPCYNCEDTLEEAVISCFKQGVDNLEIVLVDDCSKDETRKIMNKLSARYEKVRVYFHEKNLGGGATRNTAVKHASSSVIFCLDSDDILPNETMMKMLTFLRGKNADGVGIEKSIKFIGENINNIEVVHTFGYVGEKIPLESLIQKNNVYCSLYSTFMFTKEAFELAGGYPTEHGFDTQGFAWRFLSHGLSAYTCPGASYLHRVQYKDSYYMREANAGKTNYNWRSIFFEHINLFDKDTQNFIHAFDCRDFTKDFFTELTKRENIFDSNYSNIIGPHFLRGKPVSVNENYIARNSFFGLYLRIKSRFKKYIKKCELCFSFVVFFYAFVQRIKNLFTESGRRNEYYNSIEQIKKNKKIVVDLPFGGIGDLLVYSTLPRLLKKTYDIDFYLSERSYNIMRHKDAFRIFFELNPYFKGISNNGEFFRMQTFEVEKKLLTFLSDFDGDNVIEILEKQFGVIDKGKPEIYYKPKLLEEYKNVILVDENLITGKKLGWKFRENSFTKEAEKYCGKGDKIEYIDPSKQNLETYINMLYSCKYFIGTSSGGAAISACFDKPFTVVLPYNAINASTYQFNFKKSKGVYIR